MDWKGMEGTGGNWKGLDGERRGLEGTGEEWRAEGSGVEGRGLEERRLAGTAVEETGGEVKS